MIFAKAGPRELPEIILLKESCIARMRESGIDQWDDIYPTADVLSGDCVAGDLLVLRNTELQLIGCATLNRTQSPKYQEIDWLFRREPIGVIHRLMISPEFQGKGNARILMRQLEVEAQQRGCHGIRLDAYLRNPAALKLYVTLGYRRAGQVEFRKGSFACFEKRLSEPRPAATAVCLPR